MLNLNKNLIKQRFTRCLPTYAKHAHVQEETAAKLLTELKSLYGKKFARIFELGCGAGLLTKLLTKQFKYTQLFLNDLVEACEQLATKHRHCQFIGGDFEQLTTMPSALDLVISNATVQWFEDLPAAFEKIATSLAPNGIFAFSTFGAENAKEIAKVTGHSLKYFSEDELKTALKSHFELKCFHENIAELYFKEPLEVLRHLKYTGVTALSNEVWTKGDLQNFSKNYWQHSDDANRVKLTYHPLIIVAQKRSKSGR